MIEKHDSRELAYKLEYLFHHADVCREMGKNGYRKFKEHFSLSTFEERMAEILEKKFFFLILPSHPSHFDVMCLYSSVYMVRVGVRVGEGRLQWRFEPRSTKMVKRFGTRSAAL